MITFGKPITDAQEIDATRRVIDSGIFVHGKQTANFEEKFAERFGYEHAVSVANCTAGLHLAHYSLTKGLSVERRNVGEVICPAMTHVATAHAIELAGLKPVFVDCLLSDGNIDVQQIADHINSNTVGIAAMHFNGVPCDIKAIKDIAQEHGLYVVEDCAIALGAKVDGKPVGTFGDAGAFSFHPVKQMTTGEGGMLVMTDSVLKKDLSLERAFGVNRAFNERKTPGLYNVDVLGFNYRMAEIPAAIGVEQLKKYDFIESRRRDNFATLKAEFSSIDEVFIKGGEITDRRSYYCLIAELKDKDLEARNELIHTLKDNGVHTSVYYPHPVPRLNFYAEKYGFDASQFPNATNFADNCIAFPVAAHLDQNDMQTIAAKLKEALK